MSSQARSSSVWLRFLLFLIGLLGFYCVLDDFSLARVSWEQLGRTALAQSIPVASFYVGTYLSCVLALGLAHCHRARTVRILAALMVAATVSAFLVFKQLNGEGFSNHEAALVWSESSFIADAMRAYGSTYVYSLLFGAVAAVGLVWLAEWQLPRLPTWPLVLAVLLSLPASTLIVSFTQGRIYAFPVPYRIALLTQYAYANQRVYYGEREAPYFAPSGPPIADHIVLVIDESVRGDLLGINGAPFDTTPFLSSLEGRVLNYGVIPSIANNSASTNLLLQTGTRPQDLPDRDFASLKVPNLFAYMQAAGYRTYLVDAQNRSGKPQNFMSEFDLQGLDGHYRLRETRSPGAVEHDINFEIIDILDHISAGSERSFTYVLKMGAHFAYEARYPEDWQYFQPTLEFSDTLGSTRERTLNSYMNALRWTLDEFMRRLFPRFELSKRSVLLVYSSDHGQSLHEPLDASGRFERIPHGKPESPPVYQAMVPLFLIAFGEGPREFLARLYDPELKDRVSGFEIFPTLLRAAGYDQSQLFGRYSHSIFDAEADRSVRVFISGNHFGVADARYRDRRIGERCYRNEYVLERSPEGFLESVPSLPCEAATDPSRAQAGS